MVPDLYKRVVQLYPDAQPRSDFAIHEGEIEFWNEKTMGPKPSKEALLALEVSTQIKKPTIEDRLAALEAAVFSKGTTR